ncbi:MAG TPA: hypothetical protein VKA60_16595 [Blastocatellia bacterium]|nr:hypothetical protein [Blastocatellia bacterium]
MRKYFALCLGVALITGVALAKTEYKYALKMIKPGESSENIFADESIKIRFVIDRSMFAFGMDNRTNEPITVDWDKISYLDAFGRSHRLMHSGVRFIQRKEQQAPTTIPPRASFSSRLIPTDQIYIEPGATGGWKVHDLFPKPEQGSKVIGKTVSILMPLRIKGEVKDYNFVFAIDLVATEVK